ncbi:uncharacterized protein Hap1MRO34_022163 isoform 2-T2 [Clarias gariepinus]|uniref:uncharacterized protein wu:fc17b08 isoform X2 n=1 Tax=Clarias gariepinus TaxID=13013 RepID=UPI00234D79C3|nr:uncharacterized protein wu:fc17b08 isoform X2 [Clarias gariepinus]
MASSCRRRICSNEKHGVRQDQDSWRSNLIDCVGVQKILDLLETRFLEDLSQLKEYTPRIPDPHIPVVACNTMQQMINRLAAHYTSNINSQDSPQHNGTDQSPLKTHFSTSPSVVASPTAAASTQNPVLSKLLMEDQDAPLDLSFKKVQPEAKDQDCVLDLSIKKNRNPDSMLIRSPVNLTTPILRRQASDSGLAKAKDHHSSSTLGQFMAKLCSHHQRQIVDAFGFLQTEVKAVTSASDVQLSSPAVTEKPTGSDCTEEVFEIQGTGEILPVGRDKNGCQESPVSKNTEVPPEEQLIKNYQPSIALIKNVSSLDISQTDMEVNDNDTVDYVNVKSRSTNIEPKCPTLLIVKNNLGNLEAKKLSEVNSIIQVANDGTLKEGSCASETQSHTHGNDHISLLSTCSTSHGNTDPKCLPVHSSDTHVKPCSAQRTSNISSNSSRTAKKSSKGSHSRLNKSISNNGNDPDSKNDIVYVGKYESELKPQSQNHVFPKKNARKSTRGHLNVGDGCEVKTVRTLVPKSAANGRGNYPVPMPEITTSITPKQALARPDGLPAMTVPFTGDCMETVMNQNLSDQSVVTELPGDVVEITSEDLIVEPSQTGQTFPNEECDQYVQDDSNFGVHDVLDSSDAAPNSTIAEEITEEIEVAAKNIDSPESNLIVSELETEVQGQNAGTEVLLSTDSSNIDTNTSGAEDMKVESDLKDENTAKCDFLEQMKCPQNQVMTCTNHGTVLQKTCESEANVKALDSMNPDKVESISDLVVEEPLKEQLEECREVISESFVTKKGFAKHTLPSDRCLRSGASKGISEQTTVSNISDQTKHDIHEENIPDSKQSLLLSKLKHTEENMPCQDGQCNLVTDFNPEKAQQSPSVNQVECIDKVCTRQKQKRMMLKETESDKEQKVQELPNPNVELKGQGGSVNDGPENEMNTLENGESCGKNSPGKSIKVSERMPLRKRSSHTEHSGNNDSSLPSKNFPHTPERMPLRMRNNVGVNQPAEGGSCKSPNAGPVEKPGRMPLRNRNSGLAEQTVNKDSPNPNSLDSMTRMPLRSRNSSAVSQHANEVSTDVIKGTLGTITEQPSGESVTSKKSASSGHMPLRSGSGLTAEQSSSCGSFTPDTVTVAESPGRMSLRRSNTLDAEKQDCLPTPPKNKKLSPKLQKMSRTSVLSIVHTGEHNMNASIKAVKHFNDQTKVSSVPDLFIPLNPPTTSPLIPSPCKFLEALNGEANQHLISDLNSKFDKMQKGWVQMDKEGQPAPKPKNKADRLKEIWKSKRRIRKPRSLEQHKFSPVQMLFMKSFDLPNICRWFLQSTETQSLVIVKQVNTRLPSETQLGFQTLPSVPESSDCVFPSLQAERLKKHLKKFAIASPVKSNARNKRLIAKALAQGICKGKEKRESRTATRISSKPQSSPGLTQTQSVESHSKVAASAKNPTSAKNPASARILRKYSNMREKKQVQQEKLSTRSGQKSAMVKVNQLPKKAKPSAVKKKMPKGAGRGLEKNEKGGISPKRGLTRVFKSKRLSASKTTSKEVILVKTVKSPQTKTDNKKSPLHKGSESLSPPSHIMDMKPLLSEDQVLTRSQRKMEATLAQTGSPKTSAKRGMESSATLAKRTRTSK